MLKDCESVSESVSQWVSQSSQPVQPVQSSKPVQTASPASQSSQPVQSVQPASPASQSNQPVQPVQPTNPASPTSQSSRSSKPVQLASPVSPAYLHSCHPTHIPTIIFTYSLYLLTYLLALPAVLTILSLLWFANSIVSLSHLPSFVSLLKDEWSQRRRN